MTNKIKDEIGDNNNLLNLLLSHINFNTIKCCKTLIEEENVIKFLSDDELVYTAEHFFQNDLNISKTSKLGFMHRNTLLYRIEKIEKMLGLDIRKFEDALTLQIILEINKIKNKKKN